MRNGLKARLREALGRMRRTLRLDDLPALARRLRDVESAVRRGKAALKDLVGQIRLLFQLVSDYARGRYRAIPWRSVAMAAAALTYLANPLDLIPDYLPGIGCLDDALVLRLVIGALRDDLADYQRWRDRASEPPMVVSRFHE
jgi:uncharacterized membrane protein YkvA (DUF1232 family)